MKLALYARVSTDNKGQDPEMQLRDLRNWAALQQHEVFAEYIDHISGKSTSRPSLDQMMSDALTGKFEAIAVWKLDRFGRSLPHLVNSIAKLDDAGVKFISLRESIDLSTPSGRLMFHMLAAMAEFERDLIAERVKAGMRHARVTRGVLPGRKIDPEKGPSRVTKWRQSKRAAGGQ